MIIPINKARINDRALLYPCVSPACNGGIHCKTNMFGVMYMGDKSRSDGIPDNIYDLLSKYLNSIRFGSVTLIIQNGKIVQIECSEKIRTEKM